LSVVIAGCAEQAGLRKARILLHDFRAAQHVVIRHGPPEPISIPTAR
jgi:hypothetical protein